MVLQSFQPLTAELSLVGGPRVRVISDQGAAAAPIAAVTAALFEAHQRCRGRLVDISGEDRADALDEVS